MSCDNKLPPPPGGGVGAGVGACERRTSILDHTFICSETYSNWEEFVIEISEWGIYKLGGVDFDTLTPSDIERLDQFMVSQNGYIKEEVA